MADRIAVMRDGGIEQVDTPHTVFAKPSNVFVAGFIGTPQMNLLPATATAANGVVSFKLAEQEIALPLEEIQANLVPGQAYTLGIRPRGLELLSEPAADAISAEVELIEPMGSETLLHLNAGAQDIRVVVGRHQRAEIGERLHARWVANRVHVFGADGERVVR